MSDSITKVPVTAIAGVVSASYTRPADTNVYAANDALSNATSTTHAVLTFSDVGRKNGYTGFIYDVVCVDSGNQSTKPQLELWLFHTAPTAMEDNAAFDPSDAEVLNCVGIFSFNTWVQGNDTAGAGGNCRSRSDERNVLFTTAATDNDLYGCVKVKNAYTPLSGEIFTFQIRRRED